MTLSSRRPWRLALIWLLILGPFFFLSYGFANYLASKRADVGSIVFAWETFIPFLSWSIVPYWTIDAFYVISLFVCTTRKELNIHAARLLTAQVLAVTAFLLVPLRFSFPRPEADGLTGYLFDLLSAFDKPFNQAPSLHIALLVILWVVYARHTPSRFRAALHVWFVLIAVSVLTTYQHHFFDLPTGFALGWFCIWLWPDADRPAPADPGRPTDPRRRAIGWRYAVAAVSVSVFAAYAGGAALWLLWVSIALAFVSLAYLFIGPSVFQKANGRVSLAASWLLAPYLLGARVNAWLWTRRDPPYTAIRDGVWLGHIPRASEYLDGRFATIVDLSAELPIPSRVTRRVRVISFPVLDLTTPPNEILRDASGAIERARKDGGVLVCCALGYSRSALAVAAWLMRYTEQQTADAALAFIGSRRPRIVASPDQLAGFHSYVRTLATAP